MARQAYQFPLFCPYRGVYLKYAIHPPPRLSVGGGILANFW